MVVYEENPDYTFVHPYSEATAQKIDAKVKAYLEHAYNISKQTITKYKTLLEKIAMMLIEKEYISGDEFAEMIDHPESIPSFDKKKEKEEVKEKKAVISKKKVS
jgi:cell division protease FtsH